MSRVRDRRVYRDYTGRDNNRRRYDLGQVAVVVTLIFQVGALLWGAATLKASVDDLKITATKIQGALEADHDKIADHDGRLRVIEDRQDAPRKAR